MIYYTQHVKLHTECKRTLGVCKKPSVINHWIGVKTTHSVYVYTECKSTLGVCELWFYDTVYFYTQHIRIPNVLFLHPYHDFITLCIFTHTECTRCVVLHTVCNYEMYMYVYTHIVEEQKHTPYCKITVCIITHGV